jgi:hypothetical protein
VELPAEQARIVVNQFKAISDLDPVIRFTPKDTRATVELDGAALDTSIAPTRERLNARNTCGPSVFTNRPEELARAFNATRRPASFVQPLPILSLVAQLLGESGRYVSDQTRKKRLRMLLISIVAVALSSTCGGFLFAQAARGLRVPPSLTFVGTVALMLVVALIYRRAKGILDSLERERLAMQRGALGESIVANVLSRLPNEFHVINDLTTSFGNLDHVVVGPTGVFVVDAKNWRGVVAADGKGELLLNGKPTDKSLVRQFTGRMMSVRDKVATLTSHGDIYYHGVFVFTAARVEAKWGATSSVNCIRDDQLFDYIVEKKFRKSLKRHEVEQIAQAFSALAHMDRDFTEPASLPSRSPKQHHQPAIGLA